MKKTETQAASTPESDWIRTATNLYRFRPSGIYFARVRVHGKLFRKSLKTSVMSVAKLKLADYVKECQEKPSGVSGAMQGDYEKMTVGQCIQVFRLRLQQRQDIKDGGKSYREWTIVGLLKHLPDLESMEVAKLTKD